MLSAQLIKNYPTFNFIQRERYLLFFFSIGIFLLSFKDEKLEAEYQADAMGYSWILSVIFSTPCSIVLDETGQGAAGGSWVKTKEMEKESPR